MNTKTLARSMLLFACLAVSSLANAASEDTCNRDCLADMITRYVDAIVAHDPSQLPLADDVRYTEDSRLATLGEGLWQSVTGKGVFRHDYLDTRRQIAAAHVHLMEDENDVLYSIVLRVAGEQITGIETLVQRLTPDSPFQPTELGQPVAAMEAPVPEGQRHTREEMIDIALTYTEGLRIGSFMDAGTPFAPEGFRVENGVITSGVGCRSAECDMYWQRQIVHPGIIPSVAAVDEEKGVVLLWMNFGYTGPSSIGDGNAWVTFEAFKIWGGQIHTVLAFFPALPMSTARFWPTADPIPK